MKRIKLLIPAAMIFFSSCEKDLKVDAAPDFDVTVDGTAHKVGQPVNFKFTGNADMISFFSGEESRDYNFREGRKITFNYKGAKLAFNSAVTGGTQDKQLSVLISNDFKGDYSSLASIKAATWVDITDSVALGTGTTFVNSGSKNISSFTEGGGPVYVAFKYLTRPQLVNGAVRTWMIENFSVQSIELFNGSPLVVKDQAFAAFTVVDEDKANNPSRTTMSGTRLSLRGNAYEDPADPKYNPENPIYDPKNPIYDPKSDQYDPLAVRPEYKPYDPASPYNDPLRETWAVSSAITTNEVQLAPDRPIAIRGIRNPKLVEYPYTFTKPGTYEVVFVASNSTINEQKTVIKKVNLTIAP